MKIIIKDTNDNAPVFSHKSKNQSITVDEDVARGTVLNRLLATDRDEVWSYVKIIAVSLYSFPLCDKQIDDIFSIISRH